MFKSLPGLLLLHILLLQQDAFSQEVTEEPGLLSDLWSSLTQSGKTPGCPGECVHAITSIFCDHVLEEVGCGPNYLRCCVPNDFSYQGTVVETSPPLGYEIDRIYVIDKNNSGINSTFTEFSTSSSTESIQLSSSTASNTHSTSYAHDSNESNITKFNSTHLGTNQTIKPIQTSTSTVYKYKPTTRPLTKPSLTFDSLDHIPIHPECPGVCVKAQYARFCGNIMSNGRCNNSLEECCLQSDIDSTNFTRPNFPSQMNKTEIKTTTTTTTTISAITNLTPETTTSPTATNISFGRDDPKNILTTTTPVLEESYCQGTCVTTLFSLLCDEVDTNKICPNGGTCCVIREPSTTTPSPIGPCKGSCIPTILSGVCNRPSELILKTTTCMSGTICCYTHEPSFENNDDINNDYPGPSLPVPPTIVYPSKYLPPNPPQPQDPYPGYNKPHNILIIPPSSPSVYGTQRPSNPAIFQNVHGVQPSKEYVSTPSTAPSITSESNPNPSFGYDRPNQMFPGGPPFCPGPCISPLLRFTCFGGNSIYPKFQCSKKAQVCCASMNDIQSFEANVLENNGVWKPHPNESNKTIDLSPDTTNEPVKPLPPKKMSPNTCGVKGTQRRESPRIVGGKDTLPGEWCWQVALINAQNQYLCGGALIGSQWVLTAAHCITNLVRSGEAIYVRVGDYDLSNKYTSRGAQTQRVSTTYIHHNHNGQTLDNDIALLKLNSPVDMNESVCLICLPARGSNRKPGKKCSVTGYGYLTEAGPMALKIRQAEVPIVDDQQCTVKINAVTEKLFILPASSFCAGGEEGNDACQGDGGGPLVCDMDEYYELTGIVSWGFGCGRQDVPGVYVKVSSFIGWINQIISVNNH